MPRAKAPRAKVGRMKPRRMLAVRKGASLYRDDFLAFGDVRLWILRNRRGASDFARHRGGRVVCVEIREAPPKPKKARGRR